MFESYCNILFQYFQTNPPDHLLKNISFPTRVSDDKTILECHRDSFFALQLSCAKVQTIFEKTA